MFFSNSAYAVVPDISGLMLIYVDPHLPPISAAQIHECCKNNGKDPGGSATIEAARLIHYGKKYTDFLDQIKSGIELFPNAVERHVTSDGVMNIDVDAIMIAEEKIEVLSKFIRDFKKAERFYKETIVDSDAWTHEYIDARIFEHFEINKHRNNYLFEDAFIEVMQKYMSHFQHDDVA